MVYWKLLLIVAPKAIFPLFFLISDSSLLRLAAVADPGGFPKPCHGTPSTNLCSHECESMQCSQIRSEVLLTFLVHVLIEASTQ